MAVEALLGVGSEVVKGSAEATEVETVAAMEAEERAAVAAEGEAA